MATYHASFKVNYLPFGLANIGPIFDIRTGPTDSLNLTFIDVGFNDTTAVTLSYGLGIPATPGVVIPTGLKFVNDQGFQLPGATIGSSWSTLPTIPTKFFRRFTRASSNASNSGTVRFVFERGLYIAPSTTFAIWIIGTIPLERGYPFYVNLEIEA